MRRIVYTCDRCGAEIDGGAGVFSIETRDQQGVACTPDLEEIAQLMEDPEDQASAYKALNPGWDLCAECVAAVLRTLIRKDAPRAIVKTENLPKRRGGRKKKEDSNENHSNI